MIRPILAVASAALLLATGPACAQDDPPDVDFQSKVNKAIDKGISYLKGKGKRINRPDGSKRSPKAPELQLLTYLHAGVSPEDPDFKALFKEMMELELEWTYNVSIMAMVLEELDRVKYQQKIAQCAQFLVDNVSPKGNTRYGHPTVFLEEYQPVPTKSRKAVSTPGRKSGVVTFGKKPETTGSPMHRPKPKVTKRILVKQRRPGPDERDHSNMQYLALGLRACFDSGIDFEREFLETLYKAWTRAQKPAGDEKMEPLAFDTKMELDPKKRKPRSAAKKPEGPGTTRFAVDVKARSRGWCYGDHADHEAYGSMSAGAVGAICILNYVMGKDWRKDQNALDGIKWLAKNFSVTGNPGPHEHHGNEENGKHDYYYYMYGLERAGMLFGTERMDDHKWYREGAEELLKRQDKKGRWGGSGALDTCFAILFLKRATRSLDVATPSRRR